MKKHITLLICACALLAGCKSTSLYYWGDYSGTLYRYTKEPSDTSRVKHKNELLEIIEHTKSSKKATPPGIYFELAVLEAEEGNKQVALAYLQSEKNLFPESEPAVNLVIKELEAQ